MTRRIVRFDRVWLGEAVMNIFALRGRPLRLFWCCPAAQACFWCSVPPHRPRRLIPRPGRLRLLEARATTWGFRRRRWPRRSTLVEVPRSTRCRARRRATAARAGTTPTAPATSRRLWSARPAAPGSRPTGAGPAALNPGGVAAINSVSCASAGNCSAGGSYSDSSGNQQAFVASETTAPGARPSRCPAPRRSTPAGSPRSSRCRARRRATAARAGPTPTGPATSRRLSSARRAAPGGTAEEVPGTAALNAGGTA